MLDIGFQEMAIIAVIALIIIGPKDLPRALRGISQFVGKARSMAREFRSGLDDIMNETELAEVRDKFNLAGELDLKDEFTDMVDPTGSLTADLDIADDPALFDESEPAAKTTATKGSSKPRATAKTTATKRSSKPRATAKTTATKGSSKPRATAKTTATKGSSKPRAAAKGSAGPRAGAAGGKAKAARAKG